MLATPGVWEKSPGTVWTGAGLGSALVIVAAIFNDAPV